MAYWREVKPRLRALQDAGFAVYEDHTSRTLAFHLSGYLTGGDSVLLVSPDVDADHHPVVVPLAVLETLVKLAQATLAEAEMQDLQGKRAGVATSAT